MLKFIQSHGDCDADLGATPAHLVTALQRPSTTHEFDEDSDGHLSAQEISNALGSAT
jgi:hypothetical protein